MLAVGGFVGSVCPLCSRLSPFGSREIPFYSGKFPLCSGISPKSSEEFPTVRREKPVGSRVSPKSSSVCTKCKKVSPKGYREKPFVSCLFVVGQHEFVLAVRVVVIPKFGSEIMKCFA